MSATSHSSRSRPPRRGRLVSAAFATLLAIAGQAAAQVDLSINEEIWKPQHRRLPHPQDLYHQVRSDLEFIRRSDWRMPSPQLTYIRCRLKSDATGPGGWSGSGWRVTWSRTSTWVTTTPDGSEVRSNGNKPRDREYLWLVPETRVVAPRLESGLFSNNEVSETAGSVSVAAES